MTYDNYNEKTIKYFGRLPERLRPINAVGLQYIFIEQIHEQRKLHNDLAKDAMCQRKLRHDYIIQLILQQI